jgi:hypothetical protein
LLGARMRMATWQQHLLLQETQSQQHQGKPCWETRSLLKFTDSARTLRVTESLHLEMLPSNSWHTACYKHR